MTGSTILPLTPSSGQKLDRLAWDWPQLDKTGRIYKKLDSDCRAIIQVSDGDEQDNVRYWYKICKIAKTKDIPKLEGYIVITIPNKNYQEFLENKKNIKDFTITLSYIKAVYDRQNDEWGKKKVIKADKTVKFSTIQNKGFAWHPLKNEETSELSQYLYDFVLGQGDFVTPKQAPKANPKA